MAGQTQVLRKIVALKRQSAEQVLQALQLDAAKIEAAIAEIHLGMERMDAAGSTFEALSLAEENGHVRKLLADLSDCKLALAAKAVELHDAKEALKRAIYSEERLSEIARIPSGEQA